MIPSYKQPTKDAARTRLWTAAISSLCENRESSKILTSEYITAVWNHASGELVDVFPDFPLDDTVLSDFLEFTAGRYGTRTPAELRVAYLAGPEPENDLEVLLGLGVRIENVWAVESGREEYAEALRKCTLNYPRLRLVSNKMEDFLSPGLRFDILYLDFTGPLFSSNTKPYQALHKVFTSQCLEPLSVLITTSSEPDPSEDALTLLWRYFFCQPFIERSIYEDEPGTEGHLVEGPLCNGFDEVKFRELVEARLKNAYSAFATHYPLVLGALVAPAWNVLAEQGQRRQLLQADPAIRKAIVNRHKGDADFLREFLEGLLHDETLLSGDVLLEPTEYWFQHFVEMFEQDKVKNKLVAELLRKQSKSDRTDEKVSFVDAVRLRDVLANTMEGYRDILADGVSEALPKVMAAMPEHLLRGALFCDIPFEHIWLEYALFQSGFPYFCNLSAHDRFRYKAKTATMDVDVFVFDQCRPAFEFLGSYELLPNALQDWSQQLVARSCLDAIAKHTSFALRGVLSGAHLVCAGDITNSDIRDFKPREIVE